MIKPSRGQPTVLGSLGEEGVDSGGGAEELSFSAKPTLFSLNIYKVCSLAHKYTSVAIIVAIHVHIYVCICVWASVVKASVFFERKNQHYMKIYNAHRK